jgi:2-haloacid dehalogenase
MTTMVKAEPSPERKMNIKIKAFVFDAYGTLFDVHSVAALEEDLFPGMGKHVSQLWRTNQLQYSWLRSLMGRYEDFEKLTEDALVVTCKTLKLELSTEHRSQLMHAYDTLDTFPDVRQALQQLSGLPLAILSNGSPRMLHAAVANSGLEGVFREIISVDDVRIYKPSPRVYQLAVDRLKVSAPDEIGFVSSNSWDAIGAASFGFTAFWINRTDAPLDELGLAPEKTLRKLTELAELVERG